MYKHTIPLNVNINHERKCTHMNVMCVSTSVWCSRVWHSPPLPHPHHAVTSRLSTVSKKKANCNLKKKSVFKNDIDYYMFFNWWFLMLSLTDNFSGLIDNMWFLKTETFKPTVGVVLRHSSSTRGPIRRSSPLRV